MLSPVLPARPAWRRGLTPRNRSTAPGPPQPSANGPSAFRAPAFSYAAHTLRSVHAPVHAAAHQHRSHRSAAAHTRCSQPGRAWEGDCAHPAGRRWNHRPHSYWRRTGPNRCTQSAAPRRAMTVRVASLLAASSSRPAERRRPTAAGRAGRRRRATPRSHLRVAERAARRRRERAGIVGRPRAARRSGTCRRSPIPCRTRGRPRSLQRRTGRNRHASSASRPGGAFAHSTARTSRVDRVQSGDG